jgi:hypothetical protein
MDPNHYLALRYVATLDQRTGEPTHLYRHFADLDDRRRHRRQRFAALLRRGRSGRPLVPRRVRLAG